MGAGKARVSGLIAYTLDAVEKLFCDGPTPFRRG
jgi:hypothetical protein